MKFIIVLNNLKNIQYGKIFKYKILGVICYIKCINIILCGIGSFMREFKEYNKNNRIRIYGWLNNELDFVKFSLVRGIAR